MGVELKISINLYVVPQCIHGTKVILQYLKILDCGVDPNIILKMVKQYKKEVVKTRVVPDRRSLQVQEEPLARIETQEN